jgi:hypothetical protein
MLRVPGWRNRLELRPRRRGRPLVTLRALDVAFLAVRAAPRTAGQPRHGQAYAWHGATDVDEGAAGRPARHLPGR